MQQSKPVAVVREIDDSKFLAVVEAANVSLRFA
jgi:hypothetical protein